MKILCIADHIDPLVYSNSIRERFKDVDIIVSAGDLPLRYYDFIVSNLNKPLLFVFGNHNLKRIHLYKPEYRKELNDLYDLSRFGSCGAIYIGGKVKMVKGIIFAGLGGSMWYNGGLNQYTELGMFLQMLKLIPRMFYYRVIHGRYVDILVTHSPPYGINDLPDRCHTGFKVFLWFMKRFKPKYLIHGHIHLYTLNAERKANYLDTTIINAYNHCLIEW